MADKESTLAIVIRTVDKATAGIQAVNDRVTKLGASMAAPFKLFGERLEAIGKATGFTAILGAAGAVASAIKSVFATISETLSGAVAGVLSLVGHFDDLGDKAEKLGVGVDFLASTRFAAERAGSSIEALDQGLTAFGENMGQLRGGTGRMLKSLEQWAPALVPALKATKGNEQAFLLLAHAMSKITDPQKRLALAMKTVGNSELAPLLARDSKGIKELQDRYLRLAGSQEKAAEAGGLVDDSLKDLKASGDGFKAALVQGIAPALLKIIPLMTEWLSGHREQITQWIVSFGEKLPGAIDKIGNAISRASDWVNGIVKDLGGWDNISRVLGGFLRGQFSVTLTMVSAAMDQIGVAIKALHVAFDASPIGLIIENWSKVADVFASLGVTIERVVGLAKRLSSFVGIGDATNGIRDAITSGSDRVVTGGNPFETNAAVGPFDSVGAKPIPQFALDAAARPGSAQPQQAKVTVDFVNAPKGMRATADKQNTADLDLSVGHQLLFGA